MPFSSGQYHFQPFHMPHISDLIVISLHFMQKQTHPDVVGTKISNTKYQITNKSQITILNHQNRLKHRIQIILIFIELMKKYFSVHLQLGLKFYLHQDHITV